MSLTEQHRDDHDRSYSTGVKYYTDQVHDDDMGEPALHDAQYTRATHQYMTWGTTSSHGGHFSSTPS